MKPVYLLILALAVLFQACLYTQIGEPRTATVTITAYDSIVDMSQTSIFISVILKNTTSDKLSFIKNHFVSTNRSDVFWTAEILFEDSIYMTLLEEAFYPRRGRLTREFYTVLYPGDSNKFNYTIDLPKLIVKNTIWSNPVYAKPGKYKIRLTYYDSWAADRISINEPIKSNWLEILYTDKL